MGKNFHDETNAINRIEDEIAALQETKEWINKIPSGDNSWLLLPANKERQSIRVMDLPFPDKQTRTFLSFKNVVICMILKDT